MDWHTHTPRHTHSPRLLLLFVSSFSPPSLLLLSPYLSDLFLSLSLSLFPSFSLSFSLALALVLVLAVALSLSLSLLLLSLSRALPHSAPYFPPSFSFSLPPLLFLPHPPSLSLVCKRTLRVGGSGCKGMRGSTE